MKVGSFSIYASRLVFLIGSAAALVAGFAALIGWAAGLPVLTSLQEGYIPMAPSTALLFSLFGLLLLSYPRWGGGRMTRRLAGGLIMIAAALSLLLLILSVLEVRAVIEHLGMSIAGSIEGAPLGHMSPLTAVCFLLIGAALLLFLYSRSSQRRLLGVAVGAAATVLLCNVVLLFAYAFGGPFLYGTATIPPALTTSIAFLALAAATLGLLYSDYLDQGRRGQHEAPETQNKTPIPYKLLLFALFASVGIVLTVFFSFRSYVDHHRLEVERDLSSIAHLKVQELTQWREERISDGETFFRNELFTAALQRYYRVPNDPEELRAIRSWLHRVKEAYGYSGVGLFDKDGKPLVEESEAASWTHASTHAAESLWQKRVRLIDFHRSEKDGPVVLTLTVPIITDSEPAEEVAMLVLQVDPFRFLYPLIQSWPVERATAETLLVRRDGEDVLFLNEVRFLRDAPLELRLPLSQADLPAAMAIGGREGVVEGKDYRGKDVVAAILPVPNSPWFLVSKMDTAELYAPLRSMLYGSVGLVGALLVALSAIVAGMWQRRAKNHFRQLYQIEKLREESEKQHRITLQSIGDGVITTSSNGKITMMNRVAEKLTGWRFRDAYLRPVAEVFRIVCEDTGERVESPVDRVLDEGEVVGLANHTLLISKQGRRIPIADSGSPIRDDSENLYGVVLVFSDQSRERETQRRLKESEERFRLALSGASVIVATCDRDLRYTWIYNPHDDVQSETVIGKRDDELSSSVGAHELMAQKRKVVDSGGESRSEIAFVTSTGELIYDVKTRAMRDEGGEVIGASTIAWDVTARKQLEIRYTSLFNSVWDAILITDTERTIVDCNPAFAGLFEYAVDELLGKSIDCIYPDNEEYAKGERELSEYTEEVEPKILLKYRKKSGENFRGETLFSYLKDIKGNVLGIIEVIRDVTDRELLEQQLIEAQKLEALGQLAGGIAHDFNNVLMAISGASQVLEKRLHEESDQNLIAAIRSSVKRGNTVTGRMLTFTRSVEPETKPVALGSFLFEFKDIAEHTLPPRVHVYIGEVSDKQGVNADPAQLQQVLITLSINAADAMPEGGSIYIKVRRPTEHEIRVHKPTERSVESHWCIEVTDEGSGMDAETKRRAFDPFFTTKEATKGTGLGLSVAYKILQLQRGWIEIGSSPGRGATFILGLPATEETAKIYAAHGSYESGHGETILIIDDEMPIRTMLGAALSESGYQTLSAETGKESLDILKQEAERVDLIITDIGLPDINGKELIMKVRELYAGIPIIAMTGYTDTDLEAALYTAGADVVVKKPYDMDELSRDIRSLL